MYGNVYDEEERFERQAVFPKLLAKHATDFSWVRERWQLLALIVSMQNKTSFNRDAIKAGTGRRLVVGIPTMYPHSPPPSGYRYLGDCLSPQTHCYTLEVSFFGYLASHSGGSEVTTPYTEEACILTCVCVY